MKRYAGVLLPVTSLPSKYGIGCFDQAAYDFVDWLQKAGQRYWQILPLGATSYGSSDDSPYQAYSAFAGNPYLISLDALVEEGVLTREECDGVSFGGNPAKVDFDKLHEHRFSLLHKAYERSGISADADYQNFIRDNGWWLNDYALFMALKTFFHDQPFRAWPEDIRMHWGFALEHYNREFPQAQDEDITAAIDRSGGFLGQAMSLLSGGGELPQQTRDFVQAFSARDALGLMQTLASMEKWKRDALADILESWRELLESALASRSGIRAVSPLSRKLAQSRSSPELLNAVQCLQKAVDYTVSNVSPAAVCGWLVWALR